MKDNLIAKSLKIKGIVQGVGFRPHVYQLAARHGLKGQVANTAAGVSIEIEGPRQEIDAFCKELVETPPPLSHITGVTARDIPFHGFKTFAIIKSRGAAERSTLISPDMCVCRDCLKEMRDAADRRFRYPFINCTNCGPRYTIIDDVPYDRPKTSMKHFRMCEKCRAEYDDPLDRRFHAQPNACALCGPRVTLFDNTKNEIPTDQPIERAAALLKEGRILAVKGLGGFHLAADAKNDAAVRLLRQRKHREEKPFALMSPDIKTIETYARVEPAERELLQAPQRPIVLLKKRFPNAVSGHVSPRNNYFGVMLPYTPLHYLLLENGPAALVMTSGNISEEPICIDNDDAFQRLAAIADYFLVHNRDIYLRSDDAIVRHAAGSVRF